MTDTAVTKAERRNARKAARAARTTFSPLVPRTHRQKELIDALDSSPTVFAVGPAGTGKTYIAARHALMRLERGQIDRIVITRPSISDPRHRLGFQPGGVEQKMKPWMVPIWDAFKKGTSAANLDKYVANKQIEVLPFEHMRGRTIENGVFMLDEAQNCTLRDLEMFVTRIGEGGQLILSGDPDQSDIQDSGLSTLAWIAEDHDLDADIVWFTEDDVVRSAAAAEWVKAFSIRRKNGIADTSRTPPGYL